MKKLLMIAPTYMGLYKDIIHELQNEDYEVEYIEEQRYIWDPRNYRGIRRRSKYLTSKVIFDHFNKKRWENILNRKLKNKSFDILFVIDGQSLHPILFKTLKERSPQIKCINYLFDTTRGVYQFEVNFCYFDRVYSFDHTDVETYHLIFLPIYWTKNDDNTVKEYDFFGLGAYSFVRYDLFKELKNFNDGNGYRGYFKLIHRSIGNETLYKAKLLLRKLIGIRGRILTLEEYHSPMMTSNVIPTSEFRRLIQASDIIVDTSADHQDGMTARFMWALGAEKKIITTNQNAKKYDFYSPLQIYVITNIKEDINCKEFVDFVCSRFYPTQNMRKIAEKFRIDNWMKSMLEEL
jgi:hypothetical protein